MIHDIEPQLGKLIENGETRRDAIHVAIAPAEASEDLQPGQHVGLDGGPDHAWGKADKKIGIVDPYLTDTVKKGERFWLFLYPGTVIGMRHYWKHPSFERAIK